MGHYCSQMMDSSCIAPWQAGAADPSCAAFDLTRCCPTSGPYKCSSDVTPPAGFCTCSGPAPLAGCENNSCKVSDSVSYCDSTTQFKDGVLHNCMRTRMSWSQRHGDPRGYTKLLLTLRDACHACMLISYTHGCFRSPGCSAVLTCL